MKAIAKLYLKIFLFTGIPFGIINMCLKLDFETGIVLREFVYPTLFFGGFMSFFLGTFQIQSLKKIGIHEMTDENLAVDQTKIVNTTIKKIDLIEKLKIDPLIGKMKLKENENGLFFETGLSMKSWGEEIKIFLLSDNEGTFEYHISSRPKLKTAQVDYGRNHENIIRIENILKNTD